MCTEDSPSGLWRTLGKRVGCKPSGVRIPHPPPPDPGTASGSGVFVACTPPDLRPPRVLPARESSAPRVVACGAAGVLGAVGPGRPRDRHTRASLGVVDLEARPCPPGPPAPSTPAALVVLCAPARPRRPRGGLQSGGACRCEWPGSAAARGHCCQALGVPWRASIVRFFPCRAPASFPVKRA